MISRDNTARCLTSTDATRNRRQSTRRRPKLAERSSRGVFARRSRPQYVCRHHFRVFSNERGDALWTQYPIGEHWQIKDPDTGAWAKRNVWLDKGPGSNAETSVRGLQARGTIFLAVQQRAKRCGLRAREADRRSSGQSPRRSGRRIESRRTASACTHDADRPRAGTKIHLPKAIARVRDIGRERGVRRTLSRLRGA